MSKYLCNVSETNRVDMENEVNELIEEAKNDNLYELSKYSSTFKEIKKQGEVIDSYYLVVLNKTFCSPKEPAIQVRSSYSL